MLTPRILLAAFAVAPSHNPRPSVGASAAILRARTLAAFAVRVGIVWLPRLKIERKRQPGGVIVIDKFFKTPTANGTQELRGVIEESVGYLTSC